MYKQAKQDLIQAKALIENPKHWTRKAYARNSDGVSVCIIDPSACAFCASGATMKAVINTSDGIEDNDDKRELVARSLLSIVALETEGCILVDLNDDFSHEYVMSAYDKAIEMTDSATMTLGELVHTKLSLTHELTKQTTA